MTQITKSPAPLSLTGDINAEDTLIFVDETRNVMISVRSCESVAGNVHFNMTSYGLIPVLSLCSHHNKHDIKTLTHGFVIVNQALESDRTGESSVKLTVQSSNLSEARHEIVCPIDWLFSCDKRLNEQLFRCGIDFTSNRSFSQIVRSLRYSLRYIENIVTVHNGFFLDGGTLKYGLADSILRDAKPAEQVLHELGIGEGRRLNYPKLMWLCLFGLDALRHLLPVNYIPIIVVLSNDPIATTSDISDFLGVNSFRNPDELSVEDNFENIVLVDLSQLTDYKAKKTARTLSSISRKATVMIVTKNFEVIEECFADAQTLLITISNISTPMSSALRSFIIQAFLSSPRILNDLSNSSKDPLFVSSLLSENLLYLSTAILRIARCILTNLVNDTEHLETLINGFAAYLESNFDCTENNGIRAIREYLENGTYDVVTEKSVTYDIAHSEAIAYNSTHLILMRAAMEAAANIGGISVSAIAHDLKNDDILISQAKNQVKLHVAGYDYRAYVLRSDKLYPPFALRFETRDIDDPGINLCIGESGGKPIYLHASTDFENDNINVAVYGKTRSGKTFWLRNLAHEAAKNGFAVIALSVDSIRQKLFMPGADTIYVRRWMFAAGSKPNLHEVIEKAIASEMLNDDESAILNKIKKSVKNTILNTSNEAVELIKKSLPDTPEMKKLAESLEILCEKRLLEHTDILSENVQSGKIINVVLKDEEIFHDEDEKSAVDLLIEHLFEMKKDVLRETPVMFIIDEAALFDLSQDGGIVRLLLRQGSGLGFSTVLAAQYITAENARNVKHALSQCATQVAFEIDDDMTVLKRFGINSDDTEKRQMIADKPRYSFVIKGELATERSTVSYPIFASLSDEQVSYEKSVQKKTQI